MIDTHNESSGPGGGAGGGQDEVLAFLGAPASYPHRPDEVRCVQTHASSVFLAPPFVFKVKRAVDLGFLDYSTLERRKHFCGREVELNRRLTSDVYLGVVPIRRAGSGFSLAGGDGPAVEYAVKMRQLDADGFLDARLRRGALDAADVGRVARRLESFYRAQGTSPPGGEHGTVGELKLNTDENFRQTADFVGDTISPAAYETVRHYTGTFYRAHADLIGSRVEDGRVRDCHGDLRLEHIHLTPETIDIYDCIEFNDRFRYIDVANDIAFLAMDFDFHAAPWQAHQLVSEVAGSLDDPGIFRLMDFYKCYRAYVRGKVESLQSHGAPAGGREGPAGRARRFFRLATRYAVAGSGPAVLAVTGRVASGKSTLAAALADELGWQLASSDRTRKELAGLPTDQRPDKEARARLYSPNMSAKTYAALAEAAEEAAKRRGAIVLDATFGDRRHRDALRQRLARLGTNLCFLEARADAGSRTGRLAARESAPGVISDARREDREALDANYEAPTELEDAHLVTADSSGTPAETLTAALRALAGRAALDGSG